jgi:hypothetical protein
MLPFSMQSRTRLTNLPRSPVVICSLVFSIALRSLTVFVSSSALRWFTRFGVLAALVALDFAGGLAGVAVAVPGFGAGAEADVVCAVGGTAVFVVAFAFVVGFAVVGFAVAGAFAFAFAFAGLAFGLGFAFVFVFVFVFVAVALVFVTTGLYGTQSRW